MLESPAIIALLLVSGLAAVIGVIGSIVGIGLLIRWNPRGSSEAQLLRERKTYLVSTILGHVMAVKLFCLFLFISVADQIQVFLTGAMCAAGSLNANPYGYSALSLIFLGFLLTALWLLLNYLDSKAHDFPLIRVKYTLLIGVTSVSLLEFHYLFRYFGSLNPQLITSCCGSIFGIEAQGIAADVVHLPVSTIVPLFWLALMATVICGISICHTGRFRYLYPILSFGMLPIAFFSIVSFISLYIYHLPNHHCPFCLLQAEYGYVGYLLYGSILMGSVFGIGTGLAHHFGKIQSLAEVAQPLRQRLCVISLSGYLLFGILVSRSVFFSNLRLFD